MTANTAYTASSHEATKNSFSRRALIGGTAALGAVGLLSACGNGSASSEKTKAAGAGVTCRSRWMEKQFISIVITDLKETCRWQENWNAA